MFIDTVQDSTVLLRSLSYHSACENHKIVELLESLLPDHPRFTKSLVLTANIEARTDRLNSRYRENPEEVAPDDLLILTEPEKFFKMESYLVYYAVRFFNAEVLDTSELNLRQLENEVLDYFLS
jgi:hypothetical protein